MNKTDKTDKTDKITIKELKNKDIGVFIGKSQLDLGILCAINPKYSLEIKNGIINKKKESKPYYLVYDGSLIHFKDSKPQQIISPRDIELEEYGKRLVEVSKLSAEKQLIVAKMNNNTERYLNLHKYLSAINFNNSSFLVELLIESDVGYSDLFREVLTKSDLSSDDIGKLRWCNLFSKSELSLVNDYRVELKDFVFLKE